MKKQCWQGGREEAVLYGLWWETGSGRGSYINSQINKVVIFHIQMMMMIIIRIESTFELRFMLTVEI
jgi:hypothetical protein